VIYLFLILKSESKNDKSGIQRKTIWWTSCSIRFKISNPKVFKGL